MRRGRREVCTDLHLDELRRDDEADPGAALGPHRGRSLVRLGRTRLGLAPVQQRGERVEVAHVIPGPVFELRVQHLELEGEHAVEEERARLGGLDGVQDGEQVRALCGRLVEQTHARQGGQPKVP